MSISFRGRIFSTSGNTVSSFNFFQTVVAPKYFTPANARQFYWPMGELPSGVPNHVIIIRGNKPPKANALVRQIFNFQTSSFSTSLLHSATFNQLGILSAILMPDWWSGPAEAPAPARNQLLAIHLKNAPSVVSKVRSAGCKFSNDVLMEAASTVNPASCRSLITWLTRDSRELPAEVSSSNMYFT